MSFAIDDNEVENDDYWEYCFAETARKSQMQQIDYKILKGDEEGSYVVNLATTGGSGAGDSVIEE